MESYPAYKDFDTDLCSNVGDKIEYKYLVFILIVHNLTNKVSVGSWYLYVPSSLTLHSTDTLLQMCLYFWLLAKNITFYCCDKVHLSIESMNTHNWHLWMAK